MSVPEALAVLKSPRAHMSKDVQQAKWLVEDHLRDKKILRPGEN